MFKIQRYGQLLDGILKTKSFIVEINFENLSRKLQSERWNMKSSEIKSVDKVEMKLESCQLTKPI